MRRWLVLWGPPLVWMALIFFLSSRPDLPGAPDPALDRILKKSAHAGGYATLAILYVRALEGSGARRSAPVALVLTGLYAVSDEWHQTYVPGRDGNILDVLIDLAGGILGLFVWQGVRHWRNLDPSP
jgi:VanZ family protein